MGRFSRSWFRSRISLAAALSLALHGGFFLLLEQGLRLQPDTPPQFTVKQAPLIVTLNGPLQRNEDMDSREGSMQAVPSNPPQHRSASTEASAAPDDGAGGDTRGPQKGGAGAAVPSNPADSLTTSSHATEGKEKHAGPTDPGETATGNAEPSSGETDHSAPPSTVPTPDVPDSLPTGEQPGEFLQETGSTGTAAAEHLQKHAEAEITGSEHAGSGEQSDSEPGPRKQALSYALLTQGRVLPIPEYPAAARRWGFEGTVTLKIRIAQDGTVLSADVFSSSGHGILDQAAMQTVLNQWAFNPPGRGVIIVKEFEFSMSGRPGETG